MLLTFREGNESLEIDIITVKHNGNLFEFKSRIKQEIVREVNKRNHLVKEYYNHKSILPAIVINIPDVCSYIIYLEDIQDEEGLNDKLENLYFLNSDFTNLRRDDSLNIFTMLSDKGGNR